MVGGAEKEHESRNICYQGTRPHKIEYSGRYLLNSHLKTVNISHKTIRRIQGEFNGKLRKLG